MGLPEAVAASPEDYVDFQCRLEVLSPLAADSPFDSDTLWGRILCALALGTEHQQALAATWLGDLANRPPDWRPPLLISEGFQCDASNEPWLPVPLAVKRHLERMEITAPAGRQVPTRKELKKIERAPLKDFARLCESHIDLWSLLDVQKQAPVVLPALQPHLAMDRLTGTGAQGKLYMRALHVYTSKPTLQEQEEQPLRREPTPANHEQTPASVAFFLRLRNPADRSLVEEALRSVFNEGWGKAKSRGLGLIRLEKDGLMAWAPPWPSQPLDGFVSLSHFCPAKGDPTTGYWKIEAKHPVPARFVEGRRVALGDASRGEWRVKSFLRIRAGSSFQLSDQERADWRGYAGRMLEGQLEPALDGEGRELPKLYHYALAFPVPLRWPEPVDPEPAPAVELA